jgi:hypothetical protein
MLRSMLAQFSLLLSVHQGFLDLKCTVIKGENTIPSPGCKMLLSSFAHDYSSLFIKRWHEDAACYWTK